MSFSPYISLRTVVGANNLPQGKQMTRAKPKFTEVLSIGRALNFQLPDSHIIQEAYARAGEACEAWLFNHVVRCWLYSVTLARARSLVPHHELLGVAALLHDLGLAQGGAADRRFEVVGADLGREFALRNGMDERQSGVVWDSIALHTTSSIAQFKSLDVSCCQSGIACDYGGLGYQELTDKEQQAILAALPRLSMKNALTTCLCDIARKYPATTWESFIADFGGRYLPEYRRPSIVDFLLHSPFPE